MSGIKNAELNVYCEDEVAREIITLALSNELRARINIINVGSASAVVRLMAARFKDKTARPSCALLDGDQVGLKAEHVNAFVHQLENVLDRQAANDWIDNRLSFLPGGNQPEAWLINTVLANVSDRLAPDLGVPKEDLISHLEQAAVAEPHSR